MPNQELVLFGYGFHCDTCCVKLLYRVKSTHYVYPLFAISALSPELVVRRGVDIFGQEMYIVLLTPQLSNRSPAQWLFASHFLLFARLGLFSSVIVEPSSVGKKRLDRGSNPGHPQFMKGALTTELPSQFVEESSTPTA